MSSSFTVNDDVKEFVKTVIQKYNLQPDSHTNYKAGSEEGDGRVSNTIAVDITSGKERLSLFLKCALNSKSTEAMPIHKIYPNEIYFYDAVLPLFLKFTRDRGVDGFPHVPSYYGSSSKNIIALEYLKNRGFKLYDRRLTMDNDHMILSLRTFAKFHAISFAFKDQRKEEYDELTGNTFDYFSSTSKIPAFRGLMEKLVSEVVVKLDPDIDKAFLEVADGLAAKLHDCIMSAQDSLNEYSILTQGDCWCNNVMFLYGNEDKVPTDIMLVDWQLLRPASVVFDISHFFYTSASQEALDNLQFYLQLYHQELSNQIRLLGSDPDVLYPFQILQKEWKQHGKFGFAMAFHLLRVMLSTQEEVCKIDETNFESSEQIANFFPRLKEDSERIFLKRIKALADHVIKNGFL